MRIALESVMEMHIAKVKCNSCKYYNQNINLNSTSGDLTKLADNVLVCDKQH